MNKHVEKGLTADRESKYIEFKSEFDPTSRQAWCEIIKDILAITNSGGGVIFFGLDDTGQPTGNDVGALANTDPADITNKIARYIGDEFSGFELQTHEKGGTSILALVIEGSRIPYVFRKPGTYPVDDKTQKTAFKEGSVYFRHGAKSAPGTTTDLRRSFEKELKRVRKSWLSDVTKVSKAPEDSKVLVIPKDRQMSAGGAAAVIRLTDDPNAPTYGQIDPDTTHPYRRTELVERVRQKLPQDLRFNTYDVTSIWYAHNIGDHSEFFHTPKFGSNQYSEGYVDWIVRSYEDDHSFFDKARQIHYEMKH